MYGYLYEIRIILLNMENLVYKSLSEIKDLDETQGVIKGYGNVYNVKDSDGDVSLFGSFAKTVTERGKKIKIFKNHTPILVGVPLELDITDPYGLGVVAKMNMQTDAGRDTFFAQLIPGRGTWLSLQLMIVVLRKVVY